MPQYSLPMGLYPGWGERHPRSGGIFSSFFLHRSGRSGSV